MSRNIFRIIGIKPIAPQVLGSEHMDIVKAERIHKALWNHFEWHYLLRGFDIQDDEIIANKDSVSQYSIYSTESLEVTISAIVGRNGKGKSSIVDLIIRIINNLSAALMGEGYNFAAAEHLHFIDNVYAALAFQIGNTIYVLTMRDRNIELTSYRRTRDSGYVFRKVQTVQILNQSRSALNRSTPLQKQRQGRRILKSLFYTMVCNYSLYGFNYKEYLDESTPNSRLMLINSKLDGPEWDENHSWLKGIFHKNDGYQTPIVLHPMRIDGKLDVNVENGLAYERLAALLFYADADGNKPFRKVNDLDVIAISLHAASSRRFSRENMLETLAIGKNRNISKNFDAVYDVILTFWDSKYHFIETSAGKSYREDACDYIVYKTLKIISNYKKYSPILFYLSKQEISIENLREKLKALARDYSHVTKKLFQAINYLRFDVYHPEQVNVNLQDLDQLIDPLIAEHPDFAHKHMLRATLLPPPIFDMRVIMTHTEQGDTIPFERLSSGERQFAYTISNFLYHLVNLDSAWNDRYYDKDHAEVVKYHYANVIFDEVELYFHPDMQRRFVSFLMESLSGVRFSSNLRGVNIILATHSPFILSDIPSSNILCLGAERRTLNSSFAENIITLLSNGFFMDSTIGEWGRKQIEDMVNTYYHMKQGENVMAYYAQNRQRFRYLREIVGDVYLKDMTERMVGDLETWYLQTVKEQD